MLLFFGKFEPCYRHATPLSVMLPEAPDLSFVATAITTATGTHLVVTVMAVALTERSGASGSTRLNVCGV